MLSVDAVVIRAIGRALAMAILVVCLVTLPACGVEESTRDGAVASVEDRSGERSHLPAEGDTVPLAEPARFHDLPPDWTQINSGVQAITDDPGAKTWTTVTSWPYVENLRGPAHVLPEDGFFISVSLLRSQLQDTAKADLCRGVVPSEHFPPLEGVSLLLADADRVEPGSTGLPEYRFEASFGSEYYVDIRVVMRRLSPTAEARSEVETALDDLVLPEWPDRCAAVPDSVGDREGDGAADRPSLRGIHHEDVAHRLSYIVPPGWLRATSSLTPRLVDPVEVMAVGTYDLQPGGRECGHLPENAARNMSSGSALVSLQESAPRHFGPRSQPFELGPPAEHHQLGDCAERSDLQVHWTGFSEAGRGFYVLVVFGPETPEVVRAEAVAILDSVRIEPTE